MKTINWMGVQDDLGVYSWQVIIESLNLKRFDRPVNDAERLFNAQYRFIMSKYEDQKAEAELYLISEKVCTNLIRKEIKKNKLYFFSEEEINIKAEKATDYWIRRYKSYWQDKQQVYYIDKGFISTLHYAVIHAMYYDGRNDMFDRLKSIEKKNTREGIPMDEEGIKDWQQAFVDVEESINALYGREEKRTPLPKESIDLEGQQSLFDEEDL